MELSEVIYNNQTLWFILSIVFIVMFFISTIINIFLVVIRRRNLLELREELQRELQAQKIKKHVYYGGLKTTYL